MDPGWEAHEDGLPGTPSHSISIHLNRVKVSPWHDIPAHTGDRGSSDDGSSSSCFNFVCTSARGTAVASRMAVGKDGTIVSESFGQTRRPRDLDFGHSEDTQDGFFIPSSAAPKPPPRCPWNMGFVPQTLASSSLLYYWLPANSPSRKRPSPLDAIDISTRSQSPGNIYAVRPIGLLEISRPPFGDAQLRRPSSIFAVVIRAEDEDGIRSLVGSNLKSKIRDVCAWVDAMSDAFHPGLDVDKHAITRPERMQQKLDSAHVAWAEFYLAASSGSNRSAQTTPDVSLPSPQGSTSSRSSRKSLPADSQQQQQPQHIHRSGSGRSDSSEISDVAAEAGMGLGQRMRRSKKREGGDGSQGGQTSPNGVLQPWTGSPASSSSRSGANSDSGGSTNGATRTRSSDMTFIDEGFAMTIPSPTPSAPTPSMHQSQGGGARRRGPSVTFADSSDTGSEEEGGRLSRRNSVGREGGSMPPMRRSATMETERAELQEGSRRMRAPANTPTGYSEMTARPLQRTATGDKEYWGRNDRGSRSMPQSVGRSLGDTVNDFVPESDERPGTAGGTRRRSRIRSGIPGSVADGIGVDSVAVGSPISARSPAPRPGSSSGRRIQRTASHGQSAYANASIPEHGSQLAGPFPHSSSAPGPNVLQMDPPEIVRTKTAPTEHPPDLVRTKTAPTDRVQKPAPSAASAAVAALAAAGRSVDDGQGRSSRHSRTKSMAMEASPGAAALKAANGGGLKRQQSVGVDFSTSMAALVDHSDVGSQRSSRSSGGKGEGGNGDSKSTKSSRMLSKQASSPSERFLELEAAAGVGGKEGRELRSRTSRRSSDASPELSDVTSGSSGTAPGQRPRDVSVGKSRDVSTGRTRRRSSTSQESLDLYASSKGVERREVQASNGIKMPACVQAIVERKMLKGTGGEGDEKQRSKSRGKVRSSAAEGNLEGAEKEKRRSLSRTKSGGLEGVTRQQVEDAAAIAGGGSGSRSSRKKGAVEVGEVRPSRSKFEDVDDGSQRPRQRRPTSPNGSSSSRRSSEETTLSRTTSSATAEAQRVLVQTKVGRGSQDFDQSIGRVGGHRRPGSTMSDLYSEMGDKEVATERQRKCGMGKEACELEA